MIKSLLGINVVPDKNHEADLLSNLKKSCKCYFKRVANVPSNSFLYAVNTTLTDKSSTNHTSDCSHTRFSQTCDTFFSINVTTISINKIVPDQTGRPLQCSEGDNPSLRCRHAMHAALFHKNIPVFLRWILDGTRPWNLRVGLLAQASIISLLSKLYYVRPGVFYAFTY